MQCLSNYTVIVAQQQRVNVAAQSLRESEFEFFLPKIEKVSVVNGRHRRMLVPLFGRYILVCLNAAWRELVRLRGVASMMLTNNGDPVRVLQYELDNLRSLCPNGVMRQVTSDSGFIRGQLVTTHQGAFAERVMRYEKQDRHGDMAIFSLFGREQRVVFKQGELEHV